MNDPEFEFGNKEPLKAVVAEVYVRSQTRGAFLEEIRAADTMRALSLFTQELLFNSCSICVNLQPV